MAEETQTLEETREEAIENALKTIGAEREIKPKKYTDLRELYPEVDKFMGLKEYSEKALKNPFDPKNLADLAENLGIPADLADEIGSERLQKVAYDTFFSDRNAIYNSIERTGLEKVLSDTKIIPDEKLFGIIETLSEYKPTPWETLEPGEKGKNFLFATGIREHDEIIELFGEIKATSAGISNGKAMQIADEIIKNAGDFVKARYFRLRNFAAERIAVSYVNTLQNAYISKFTTEDGKERKIDRSKVINFIKESVGDLSGTIYYIVGPPAFVGVMTQALEKLGVSRDDMRFEEFTGYWLDALLFF